MRRLVERAILAALVAGAIARVHAPAGIDEDASFRCAKRRGLIRGSSTRIFPNVSNVQVVYAYLV
jgi:hypothetical protein